jgi:outer membrane lipoprotein-sorting protein
VAVAAGAALVLAVAVARPVRAPAATTPGPAETPTSAQTQALVRTALDAPKHVSYVGQLQTVRWGTRTATATIQRVEHLAPDTTRRTYLAPEALYGEYAIEAGETTTRIDPKRRRVIVTQNQSVDSVAENSSTIALLSANYRAVVGPTEIVAGRPTITVSLVNKFTGERTMRLWIDNETKVVLAKERYRHDGALASRARYDEIRFTNEIPAGVFVATVPPGFQSVEGQRYSDIAADMQRTLDQVPFKPVEPRYLPNGFKEIGAALSTFKGLQNLHILYSDGIRALSLFENNTDAAADFGDVTPTVTHFEGHEAEYVTSGPTTLLSWRERGLAFALVGDLDLKEMTDIAISVVP